MVQTRGIRIVVDELGEFTAKQIRRIGIRTTKALREVTPRDTGHARSNWIPTIGVPFSGVAGSKESVEFTTQESALARVAATGARSLIANGLSITNNVPYIEALANGSSSQQRDPGWIEREVVQVIRGIEAEDG